MPIYEYDCNKCGAFEKVQKISDGPLDICPECGGPVKRVVSQTSFALKGSGWYKDGYASQSKDSKAKGPTATEKESSTKAKTSSKPKS